MALNVWNNIIHWWGELSSGEMGDYKKKALFSRLTYLWVIIVGIFFWPIMDLVIGPESYTFRSPLKPTLRDNYVYMLVYSPHRYLVFYFLMMFSSLLSLLNVGGMLIRLAAWLSFIVIASSSNLVFNAGMQVASLWLFFLIFVFPLKTTDWKVLLTRISFIGIQVQFLIAYFFAGIYKLRVEDWRSGVSIHLLSFLDYYTPEWLAGILQSSTIISGTLNYVILIYLIAFPFLVWLKRIKIPFLMIGVMFHLYTAFIMKLYDFGTIMLIGYVLFLSEEHINWLLEKLDRIPVFRWIGIKIKT
jgi:hypothetical protein